MENSLPLPSGFFREIYVEMSGTKLFLETVSSFLENYGQYFFLAILIILFFVILIKNLTKKRRKIEKLWTFILFFLSKRMMMIPMIITFSRQDEIITKDKITYLLNIREECKKISIKKSPMARLEIEKQVSRILLEYFSNKDLNKNPHLQKIINDLEFIDKKLIELQKIYNITSRKWNNSITFLAKIFSQKRPFRTFELFENK